MCIRDRYMQYASYASTQPAHSWSEIAENFVNGQTATAIVFVNHASSFVRTQSANVGVEIGYGSIPGRHPLLGGGCLCIGKSAKQPEEAYTFLQWATGEEIAPELVMLGGLSACKCVYEQREILEMCIRDRRYPAAPPLLHIIPGPVWQKRRLQYGIPY